MTEDKMQVWQPTPFEGSDLLPIQRLSGAVGPADIPVIIEDDIESDDIRLPNLMLLQGTSKPVQNGVDGAVPGRFFLGSSELALVPPVRVIIIARFRGNAMFVREREPEYEGLEDCISRDGKTGTRYGACELCGRCTEWREGPDGMLSLPPLGTKTQQFVVWSSEGLSMLRVSMSNKQATKNMRDAMTRRTTTNRNWWAHPMLLFADKEQNAQGKPYYVPRMRWDETQVVPDDVQRECAAWYVRAVEALKAGTLTDDVDRETPSPPKAHADGTTSHRATTSRSDLRAMLA